MSLDERFQKAADTVQKLRSKPTDEDLLEVYSLFKQGTVGDVNIDPPGTLDLKAKAKWDAWSSKKGVDHDSAREQYITKVQSLIDSIGLQE